jgi:hypothetical protein
MYSYIIIYIYINSYLMIFHMSIYHDISFARGSSRIFYFCNDPSDEIRRASELNDATARAELRGKRQRLDVHVPEVGVKMVQSYG